MADESRTYRTFYGSRSSNTCAYCCKHYMSLTPKQMETRKCLPKQCGALLRVEHPIWEKKKKTKELRKARKDRLNRMYEEVRGCSTDPSDTRT